MPIRMWLQLSILDIRSPPVLRYLSLPGCSPMHRDQINQCDGGAKTAGILITKLITVSNHAHDAETFNVSPLSDV